ncbi:MAG: DEAD/DEAH box helicase [Deltaproteobacteria bacterium]|nr:DEAD/DEAH box helicase [Deltaproteobacteria bacterium]
MEVALAKTFFDSAARLAPDDRRRVYDFVNKFYADPTSPGISLERVVQARDADIWSARVTQALRAIVHKHGDRALVLYAGQHDDAYTWAARRRLGTHPVTGAVQIVETTEEIERVLAKSAPAEAETPPRFPTRDYADDYLLSLGVPEDWLPTLRRLRTDDEVLTAAGRLPEEVGERLLALADGEVVTPPAATKAEAPLPANIDNLRRFYVVESESDLAQVLNQPLEAWIRFLHPSQRSLVTASFSGPAKVTGSAGTGKTVVAMHRARALARKGKHVLLTSFVGTLCRNIERNLRVLCTSEETARITVNTVLRQALQVARVGRPGIQAIHDDELGRLLEQNRQRARVMTEDGFIRGEWSEVIDRQGITIWDAYRDADRRGRGRPLNTKDRQQLWAVFEGTLADLEAANRGTWAQICRLATAQIAAGKVPSPFDAVVVDEIQDLSAAAVQFVAALGGTGRDGLILVGDAGQRIYPGGFSLRALGIDVRGRSRVLRINYRTTEQIQRVADRLGGSTSDDLDEGTESRRGTVSLLQGPEPVFRGFATEAEEHAFAVRTIRELIGQGLAPAEVATFTRARRQGEGFAQALRDAGLPVQLLSEEADDDDDETAGVVIGTMHRAKGLEFKAVIVGGCDAQRLPNAYVLGQIVDPAEKTAAVERERRLLYVSLTRARDEAFVTWAGTPSPFVADLVAGANTP